MNLKKIAFAALVSIASISSAYATDYTETLQVNDDGSLSTGFFSNVKSGSFTDTFTFSPDVGASDVVAIVSSIASTVKSAVSFTSVSLNNYSLFVGNGTPSLSLTGLPVSVVDGTTLVLTVSGTSIAGGSYSGNVSVVGAVSAVPEPATYGMMLVGVAMVGYMARRRKSAPVNTARFSMAA